MPLRLTLPDGRRTSSGKRRVDLSDGGVYDNLGLRAVWAKGGTVLVSDGGAPFDFEAGSTPVARLRRYAAIASHHVDKLNWQWLMTRLRRGELAGTTWRIQGASDGAAGGGYGEQLARGAIAKVRTDMDGFQGPLIGVLENHGYAGAAARLDKNLGAILKGDPPAPCVPHGELLDQARAKSALEGSDKRRSLRSLWGLLRDPGHALRARLAPRKEPSSA